MDDATPLAPARNRSGAGGRPLTPEYVSWQNMRARCNNPNAEEYANYGGRGITVCPEWQRSYQAFLAHVGRRPSPKHTLDRIDPDGHYEPGNVRWATRAEQARNRRVEAHGSFQCDLCGKSTRTVRGLRSHQHKVHGVDDLTGERFGAWLVLEQRGRDCRCQCDCGVKRIVDSHSLRRGATRSCGCRMRDGRPRYWRGDADSVQPSEPGRGHRNSAKTHCPRGHEYTPENTYQDPSGKRSCRTCRLERKRIYNARPEVRARKREQDRGRAR